MGSFVDKNKTMDIVLYMEILKYLKIEMTNLHKWMFQFDVRNGQMIQLEKTTTENGKDFRLVQYNLYEENSESTTLPYIFNKQIRLRNNKKYDVCPQFKCEFETYEQLIAAFKPELIIKHIQDIHGKQVACVFGKKIMNHIKNISIVLYNCELFPNTDTLCYNLMPTLKDLELFLNVKKH